MKSWIMAGKKIILPNRTYYKHDVNTSWAASAAHYCTILTDRSQGVTHDAREHYLTELTSEFWL